MSKAGKQKGMKSKEATAKYEDEVRFVEDSADTRQKIGQGKLPGVIVPGGRESSTETPGSAEASADADQAKRKSAPFKRFRKTFAHSSRPSSKHPMQSPTSSMLLGDASTQSEEATDSREVLNFHLENVAIAILYLICHISGILHAVIQYTITKVIDAGG